MQADLHRSAKQEKTGLNISLSINNGTNGTTSPLLFKYHPAACYWKRGISFTIETQ
jgi:hypothetical protein